MTAIELRFPTGKWHATPWGRQVNEGTVEWPPAPWRLLRAILAVWHYKFPDVPEAEVRELIAALASPPCYHLPEVSQGHTRHFMPAANDVRTKVFDTFVAISPLTPVLVGWPHLALSEGQRALLSRLLEALSYLGRAESWVEARLSNEPSMEPNVSPLNENGIRSNEELVRVLAPVPDSDYAEWRKAAVSNLIDSSLAEKRSKASQKGKSTEGEKLSKKERESLESSLPVDLFDALHVETNTMRAAGWNRPPGSHWLDYVRPKEGFSIPVTRRLERKQMLPRVARLAVAGTVLPRLTEAVLIGERVRTALLSISGGHPIFAGKADNGGQSRRSHTHTHFLVESAENHRTITHVTLYAYDGFDTKALKAISQLRGVWGRNNFDLQLVPLGNGDVREYGGFNESNGETPILATSTCWESRTPFVPTDHFHIRGAAKGDPQLRSAAEWLQLEQMIRKELTRRDWLREHADSVKIERTAATGLGGKQTSWLHFKRERREGGGKKSSASGYGFRLTFIRPVQGPIALGYGCHFGLGLFTAIKD